MKLPRAAYQQLAMAVDAKRVQERSRQLDADLAKLYDDTLVPLLDMHDALARRRVIRCVARGVGVALALEPSRACAPGSLLFAANWFSQSLHAVRH